MTSIPDSAMHTISGGMNAPIQPSNYRADYMNGYNDARNRGQSPGAAEGTARSGAARNAVERSENLRGGGTMDGQ